MSKDVMALLGSPEFGHLSLAARCLLLGDLTSAISASDKDVEQGTHQKQHLAWMRWSKCLETVELFDDTTTHTLKPSSLGLEHVSSVPSLHPYDLLAFQAQLIASLPPAQFLIPSIIWRRPLRIPTSPTLTSTVMVPLCNFYSASACDTKI
jgi:hypothetical protein